MNEITITDQNVHLSKSREYVTSQIWLHIKCSNLGRFSISLVSKETKEIENQLRLKKHYLKSNLTRNMYILLAICGTCVWADPNCRRTCMLKKY